MGVSTFWMDNVLYVPCRTLQQLLGVNDVALVKKEWFPDTVVAIRKLDALCPTGVVCIPATDVDKWLRYMVDKYLSITSMEKWVKGHVLPGAVPWIQAMSKVASTIMKEKEEKEIKTIEMMD